MLVTRLWGILPEIIDKKTCNKIIRLGYEKFETSKEMVGDNSNYSANRSSEVVWLTEQWLFDLVWPHMVSANENGGWKFDIKKCEALQLTRYKEGGFYNFHRDGQSDHLSVYKSDGWAKGLCRKLSMTVLLNTDYEGGEFQFAVYEKEKCKIVTPKNLNKAGSVVVFPSFMEHRVAPVTKGVRYSLVVWFLGPPFK